MIAAPAGMVAVFTHDGGTNCIAKPVVAFDDDGRALVMDARRGELVTARGSEGGSWHFARIDGAPMDTIPARAGWYVLHRYTSCGDDFEDRFPIIAWSIARNAGEHAGTVAWAVSDMEDYPHVVSYEDGGITDGKTTFHHAEYRPEGEGATMFHHAERLPER